ncbi:MAG: sn-glycerol-1-phosphate dehydrogenase, partial [Verrucomicrobia bacterium]|nr:sn-glycerol-1-phosphate dehydrogenase [Verrucomicrobiota bacterium]
MTGTPQPLSLSDALRAARETRCLEIGEGVLRETPRVFRELFGSQPAVIVADENTFAAAGHGVQEAFQGAQNSVLEPFVFRAPDLYAEHRFVVELERSLRRHGAIPVAVGSGTINDLTKLAAHRTSRSYLCVATAASMDGYTAFGASITHQGSKQTFHCPAPAGVVADLRVIGAAPAEMNAWGYADLLAKVTAGADWVLANALGVEPIDWMAWNMVQGRLRDAVADPAGVRAHHPAALGRLVEGLMLGGFAMQAAQSSRPASGAEHQFSHLWDMQHHTHHGCAPSHGLKVGIGTLAVTALYECLLQQPFEALNTGSCCAAWLDESAWEQRVRERFGQGDLATVAMREISAKHISAAQLRQQLEQLRAVWPQLKESLRRQLIPLGTLKQMLRDAGAATEPEQIGLSREQL